MRGNTLLTRKHRVTLKFNKLGRTYDAYYSRRKASAVCSMTCFRTWQRGRVSQNTDRKPDKVLSPAARLNQATATCLSDAAPDLSRPPILHSFGWSPGVVVVSHLGSCHKPSFLSMPTVSSRLSGTACERERLWSGVTERGRWTKAQWGHSWCVRLLGSLLVFSDQI